MTTRCVDERIRRGGDVREATTGSVMAEVAGTGVEVEGSGVGSGAGSGSGSGIRTMTAEPL